MENKSTPIAKIKQAMLSLKKIDPAKRNVLITVIIALLFIVIVSLTQKTANPYNKEANQAQLNATYKSYTPAEYNPSKTYKDRVFYEIFVRSFNDSNSDGCGDLKGITQRLDYLDELGISGIWLMPINESPSYHGYDIQNYYTIAEDYGTMDDFYQLINEAHKRDIVVIMDLVINHTSKKHPWFLESMYNKESKYREYYSWMDGFSGKEPISTLGTYPWVKARDQSYYAVFSESMPDLNFDNPEVKAEIKKVAKYYLDMGVDGFRLDAARHIYDGELDKNLQWWKEFNEYVKGIDKDAIVVGEVWDKAEVVSDYIASLDTAFNFQLSESIIKSIKQEDFSNLGSSIKDIHDIYTTKKQNYLDSTFLTNHDMNRVASQLNTSVKHKHAAALLLTLPGTPYIYYGEETGMKGMKPDEKIREPFIWDNEDRYKNTYWQIPTNKLNDVAVSVQEKDPNSLLSFYKTFIHMRNNNKALIYGDFEELKQDNNNVFAFKRTYEKEEIYILINVSTSNKKINIPALSCQVLYSSEDSIGDIDISDSLELKGNEILVVKSNIK